MSSSARRGQVEPLPALVALAVFAVALSVYGTTLADVPVVRSTEVTDATVDRAVGLISEGTVVQPDRLQRLDGRLPEGTTVVVRADGRQWRWGPVSNASDPFEIRHVLVRTDRGAVPGTLRVSA